MKASDVRNKLDKLIKESEVIDPLTDKLCKEWEEGCGWAGVIQKQINKAVENNQYYIFCCIKESRAKIIEQYGFGVEYKGDDYRNGYVKGYTIIW